MHVHTSHRVVQIDLAERSYPIVIGHGLLDQVECFAGAIGAALIVTNDTVEPLYAHRLYATLSQVHRKVGVVTLPDGEVHKDWPTLQKIFDALLVYGSDRRTTLYALGGGVIGDMTGFAAACYMRGVPFVQVPTTLLAQVDSSVGGKTAINHPLGKNMIGAFHQPQRVVCDLATLSTLPQREFSAGLAEIIKYGPIADSAFLEWIEGNLGLLLSRDQGAMMHAVQRSCQIKARIVGEDEKEIGLRAILNFGHTFGHAIEAGLGYGQWLHGEAVGCGMVMALQLSQELGLISPAYVDRVRTLIKCAGLPTRGPRLGAGRYLELMRLDKKAEAGEIRFVVLADEGLADVRAAPDELVGQVIERCCD